MDSTPALQLVILLFSVILHEVMHGVVALKFGDHTAQRPGRLTLNPIPHIDPIGTILVPALMTLTGSGVLFGWAKPVPVNPLNFSNLRRAELFVSAAGVAANFGLAIIAAVLYRLLQEINLQIPLISILLQYTVFINLLLGIFNLIPIPPLDGSKMLMSQLSYKFARSYESLEKYGPFILLILIFTGVLFAPLQLVVRSLLTLLLYSN